MQEILRGYQTKLWCHQKFSATIITSVLWGGVTLFWSMRYLPSADGPLNVFFKLPVTEISQVDDHKSVSPGSFKISFKISQVDSHKSVSLPFLEVSRRMSEQRRYFFHIMNVCGNSKLSYGTAFKQVNCILKILRRTFSSIQLLCIIFWSWIYLLKKYWKH